MNQESSFRKNKKNLYSLFSQLNSRAFTLAEILVVMAIVAIMGTILVAIFTNTLRGSNKAQILAVIKQNGQAVLENMDKTIRNADSIICPKIIPPANSESANTLVTIKNGVYTRFSYIQPIATNGYFVQDSPVAGADLKLFIDNVCTSPLETSNQVLTDTNPQSGVSVECTGGCFKRNKSSGYRDQVTINFKLKPGVGAPAIISSQLDAVTFQTTIELR